MESLSRCIYPAHSLPITSKAVKTINTLNFNYKGKRKTHYLKKAATVKNYENGGLQAIDLILLVWTSKN